MIVGYFLEQTVGLVLASCVMITRQRTLSGLGHVSERALKSFNDCTTFFVFSVEIAAIVVLIREEFGISTSGMGDATVRITEAASVLVLLPLLYKLIVPQHAKLESPNVEKAQQSEEIKQEDCQQQKDTRSFILLVLCWLLAFFPFYCKMNDMFGPSQISPSGIITPAQFTAIENMCTAGVQLITNEEDAVMTTFQMASYIPLSVFIIGRIFWLGLEKHHSDSRVFARLEWWRQAHFSTNNRSKSRIAGLIAVPVMACGLLWSVLRVQQFQQQMASANGSGDTDTQWTFGQVVAVTVFAPVVVESWSAVRDRVPHAEDGEESMRRSNIKSPPKAAAAMKRISTLQRT